LDNTTQNYNMKIYNAQDTILGRLATTVAKDVMLGEEVHIINCEKAVISGRKVATVDNERTRRLRKGYPLKSAKFSRLPDRYVRRTIRGMLPWKFARGKEAFDRIHCHISIPVGLQDKINTAISLTKESKKKLPTLKYITVGEVCKQLGGRIS